MLDIVSMGEAVIDFSMCGTGPNGNPAYEMNPGGAPANCVVASAQLGAKNGFISMVGDDPFGHHIAKALEGHGITARGLRYTKEGVTRLAFVSIDETGDRSFYFVPGRHAERLIKPEEVPLDVIDEAKILHISCVYDKGDPGYDAVDFALDYAQKNGKIISCDPNYRPGRWDPASGYAREYYRGILSRCHLIKVSEEEMSIVTGVAEDQVEEGAKLLMELGVEKKAVFVTLGSKGAYYITPEEQGYVPGFKVDAVDTTGCGDSFMGSMHYFMCYEPDMPMAEKVRRANAVGALCALKHGAFDAMPTPEELEAFLAERA